MKSRSNSSKKAETMVEIKTGMKTSAINRD